MNRDSKTKPQIDKFKDAARKLETDESEENFDRLVKKIATRPKEGEKKPARVDKK